jgi:hypothetical protein
MAPGRGASEPCSASWMPKGNQNGRKPFWMAASSLLKRAGVGKTQVGKGSTVMVVADGNGLPIGLHVDSAQLHELTLAETTLSTIRVPRPRGRPKARPKELVADKAYGQPGVSPAAASARHQADDSRL